MPKIQDIFRAYPGGTPVASQADMVDVFAHDGDASLTADIDTDGDGLWSWTYTPAGSTSGWTLAPGGVYWSGTYAGQTRKGSSLASGMWGSNSIAELPILFSAFGDGVIVGALSGDFAATYDGAGLDVDIAAGKALLDGIVVTNPSSRELVIGTAHATNPRIDRIILELTRTEGDTYGKVVLKVKAGTAAASPTPPALTDDANTLQISLAQVRVNANATTVTSVTDERISILGSAGNSRNPTLISALRVGPAAVALTTSDTTIAGLQHSVTLLNGVTYDISIEADLMMILTGASAGALTAFIDGTSNTSATMFTPGALATTYLSLRNVHTRTVVGTGAAITVGVRARKTSMSTDTYYYTGSTLVTAIPRT